MLETEAEFLRTVVDSLKATFPLVAEEEIRECVTRIHRRFEDATVRVYIPVLLLRQARAELMHLPVPRPASDGLLSTP